jgi:hypothetical protein
MRVRVSIVIVVLAMFGAWGCEHAPPLQAVAGGVQPNLTSIQANIFDRRCAIPACHEGANPPLGLKLTAGDSYQDLINQPSGQQGGSIRVIAFQPDNSYLVHKLEGTVGIAGVQMPRNQNPLSVEEIQAIRDWIAAGAPDN